MMLRRFITLVFASLVALAGLLAVAPSFLHAAPQPACFAQTQKCIDPRFLDYWNANGGLAQQGYPITDPVNEVNPTDGKTYLTQYFERARFEYHPENQPPYQVLLGLLGREQFLAKYPNGRPPGGTGDVCFAVTSRCVRGIFYGYWQQHGGLAQQGYPISDEFDEINPTNGQTYRVQYFERARFEYHPETPNTPVLLGLLGREQLSVGAAPTPTPSPPPTPTATPSPTPTATPVTPPATGILDPEEADFLTRINAYRTANGLQPLTVSSTLTAAARWLSADMAAKQYFSHVDSLGRDPVVRMCAFGYCANTWKGENIAAGNATAAATFLQWQGSPPHNANMLNPNFTVIGIGRARGGPYGWYWTTDFGGASP